MVVRLESWQRLGVGSEAFAVPGMGMRWRDRRPPPLPLPLPLSLPLPLLLPLPPPLPLARPTPVQNQETQISCPCLRCGGGRRSRHRIPEMGRRFVSLDFARAWAGRMQRQRRRQWQRQRRRQRQLNTSVKLLLPHFDGVDRVHVDTIHGVLKYKRERDNVTWTPPSACRQYDLVLCDDSV